jgi:hypothetical protein
MASGLYPADLIIERYLSSVSAETLGQKFVAPVDLDVLGIVAILGTAPGANDGLVINVSNTPTSQTGVSAYNLWTAANAPSILGTSTANYTTTTAITVVENTPYPVNYPFPGTSGTVGYKTAQSTSTSVSTPVVTPPTISIYQMSALVAPDNTYTDFNGYTLPALYVHAGDVLSFVLTAGGTGASVGASASLELVLYAAKH